LLSEKDLSQQDELQKNLDEWLKRYNTASLIREKISGQNHPWKPSWKICPWQKTKSWI
jgi:hypothetical protein